MAGRRRRRARGGLGFVIPSIASFDPMAAPAYSSAPLFAPVQVTPDARYVKGALSPQWRQFGIPEEDEDWVNLLFSWCAWPYDPGHRFALNLREAVLWRLAYERTEDGSIKSMLKPSWGVPRWETFYSQASGSNFGFAYLYVDSLLKIARDILDSGQLPFSVSSWDCETDEGPPVEIMRPLQPGEAVTPAQLEDVKSFVVGLTSIGSTQDYASSRAAEIASVKRDIEAGAVKLGDTPELMTQAIDSQRELEQAQVDAQKELEALEAKKAAAIADRDAAAQEYLAAGGSPANIGSWLSKTVKKVRSQVKRSWGDVVDEATRARNNLSHSLLPSVVKDFGRSVDSEARRLGRRIDDQFQRAIRDVAEVAPWIQALGPLLGFIPIVGELLWIITAGALAAVEITYTLKMKAELDHQLRLSRELLNQQIQAIYEQAERLRAEAEQLRQTRALIGELSKKEQERRLSFAAGFLADDAKRHGYALVGAAGAALAGVTLSRRWWVASLPVLAYLAWAFWARKNGPLAPYQACLELPTATPEECRDAWLDRQLGPRPDWQALTLDELRALTENDG